MQRWSSLSLSFLVWIFSIGTLAAAEVENFAQMTQKAAEQGSIRVVVQMAVPDIETVSAASTHFKGGRADTATIVQAASADVALATRIAASAEDLFQRTGSKGVEVMHRYSAFPMVALEVSPDALTALAQDPQVIQITEDHLMRPTLNNVVDNIGATDSWDNGYAGTGWYVAVLDTGIRSTHEFFSGKTLVEACYSASDHCPNNDDSMTGAGSAAHHPSSYAGWDHGTHVAGIAAGNDDPDLNGVANDAGIIAIQVFSRFDDDTVRCAGPDYDCVLAYSSDVIAGLDHVYGLRNAYNIASVNLSLGGGKSTTTCDSSSYKTPIDLLRSVGIATVVASGNNGYCDGISAPACVSSAIAVGASTDADVMTSFSNYHPTLLDLFAPGASIYSSTGSSDTSYGSWSGTSMAAPHVAGAFAILRQADASASVTELLDNLIDSGAANTGSAKCSTSGTTLPVTRIQVNHAATPPAPDGLVATASDADQIDLSWNDNANNEQGFSIERKTGAGGTFSEIDTVGSDTVNYSDNTALTEATAYFYRVRAYGLTNSDYSPAADDTTNLVAPASLTATVVSDTQIDLSWTDGSAAETSVIIERRQGTSGFSEIQTLGANTVSYSDTTLSPGITYVFRIRGSDGTLFSLYAQTSATTTGGSSGGGGGGSSGGCFISATVP